MLLKYTGRCIWIQIRLFFLEYWCWITWCSASCDLSTLANIERFQAMFLPYCRVGLDWDCFRGCSLGFFAFVTLYVCVFIGCRRIFPVVWRTGWYKSNFLMLSLAILQLLFMTIQCWWLRSPRLLFFAKYVRGLQVAIACLLYGKLACEIMNCKRMLYGFLLPTVLSVFVLMSVNLFVMMSSPFIDCHHTSWLMMSLSSAVLTVSFSLSGRVVLAEIRNLSAIEYHYGGIVNKNKQYELEQSHRQLWILLVVNSFSTILQLLLDLYITYLVAGEVSCDSIFFTEDNRAVEQIVRLALSLCGYIVPIWAILYAFYWMQRHQFETGLDVPDIILDEDRSEKLLNSY